jgi:ABC-type multidrug transport system fused ATPase/permease subunit
VASPTILNSGSTPTQRNPVKEDTTVIRPGSGSPTTPPPINDDTFKDEKSISLWRFLWPQIRQYKWLVVAALFFNAMHGISVAFQTVMPKYLIDNVILAPSITMPVRWRRLAMLITLYLIASVFGRMLVWHIGYRIFTYVREKVLFGVRATFFRHVNHLCLRFHRQHHSGELFSYLFGSPLAQVQNYFQQFTYAAPGALFIVLSTIVWVATWDLVLTAVLCITTFATVWAMHLTRLKIQRLHTEFQKTETTVTGYVADLLRGSRDVKLYAMEDKVAEDFESKVWEIGQKSYQRDIEGHLQYMKQETIGYFCTGLLCVAVFWRYFHDRAVHSPHPVTVGTIQAYFGAFIQLQASLSMLFQMSTLKAGAQAGVDRINAVMKTDSTTPDPIGYEAPLPPRGEILLYNVTFGYDPDRPVLIDLNLTIPYGQRVALVGPSGAGKSTITQLLLRLYDPDQGVIRIGGLNLQHCRGSTLRQHFGVVPQDPFIFRTTLRENLTVARPDATDAEIQAACEMANAWEFISQMPDGLETRVGEGGSTLSGGQRQRLAIARAMLANPEFYIFDEATSALDTVSEALVQGAVENAVKGKTAFIIAHRLSTVRNCDRILVIANNGIAQDGTFDELVEQPGLFRDLVKGQILKH